MPSSIDFLQNPIMPGQDPQATQPKRPAAPPQPAPSLTLAPKKEKTMSTFGFTVVPDDGTEETALEVSAPTTKKRGRPRKDQSEQITESDIITSDGTVELPSTLGTYMQTGSMLKDTLDMIDNVLADAKTELDKTISSRTTPGRGKQVAELIDGMRGLLDARIRTISEINTVITRSNDLDYKKLKDQKALEAGMAGDDKTIMDLYAAMVKSAYGPNPSMQVNIPTMQQATMGGNGIIRSDIGSTENAGYASYLQNLTPEQNTMFYENDPNVKTVVVYNAATNEKFFQVMNMATGQVVPNVSVLDNRFMEDTVIDLNNMVARNNNLHMTFPVIMANQDVLKEY